MDDTVTFSIGTFLMSMNYLEYGFKWSKGESIVHFNQVKQ